MTNKQGEIIRRAAVQSCRYESWSRAVVKQTRMALKKRGRTRARDLFLIANPRPVQPKRPDGMTEKKYHQSPAYLEYREALRLWNASLDDASRDRRGEGKEERRGLSFPEPTGDEVIESLTNGDIRRWAALASDAIQMTKRPGFLEESFRPKTPSERFGGEGCHV